jgi:predicted nucleic acid-binding protein
MASVVVDTSVWINHFRENNQALVDLLEADAVLMHPMVVAEIACGTPPLRLSTLSDLKELQKPQQATLTEVMEFVERERLYELGCGIVDMILLASTIITPDSKLWTLDKKLVSMSEKFGVEFSPNFH